YEWGEGIGRVRHQVQFRGPNAESIDLLQHQSDKSDHPSGGRSVVAYEVPEGATEARFYSWYYVDGAFTIAPEGSTIYVGEYSAAVADSEAEALAQVEECFDGDFPDVVDEGSREGAYSFPFFPVFLADSTVQGEHELTVEGDAPVWPVGEIQGPGRDVESIGPDGSRLLDRKSTRL